MPPSSVCLIPGNEHCLAVQTNLTCHWKQFSGKGQSLCLLLRATAFKSISILVDFKSSSDNLNALKSEVLPLKQSIIPIYLEKFLSTALNLFQSERLKLL